MNYYVLYCQTLKAEKVCTRLNRKKGIYSYIPKMEYYFRLKDEIITKVMFPGYVFIKTELNQLEFDDLLYSLNEERDGIIRELKKTDVSALTKDEVTLFKKLLDDEGILRMSYGYKENGMTVITSGPLIYFENCIIRTDKRDMIVVLDIKFFDRYIKAGLFYKQSKQVK